MRSISYFHANAPGRRGLRFTLAALRLCVRDAVLKRQKQNPNKYQIRKCKFKTGISEDVWVIEILVTGIYLPAKTDWCLIFQTKDLSRLLGVLRG